MSQGNATLSLNRLFRSEQDGSMRWRFLDTNSQDERAYHDRRLAQIHSWWTAFANATAQISELFAGTSRWDLLQWMATHLQVIDERLMWEFGPAVRGKGHRLVTTPESARNLRPLTAIILDLAPSIDGWEFYGYRPSEEMEVVRESVRQRTGGDIDGFSVAVRSAQHRRIDLRYFAPVVSDDQAALHAAFIATEGLLGESCVDKWIGAIDVSPSRRGLGSIFRRKDDASEAAIPLHKLREAVESLVDRTRDQLPHRPHLEWAADTQWTMWKLNPRVAEDYPEQSDLFVGKSANPDMWEAAHSGDAFFSERFSSCGEAFCYLKLDGSAPLDEEFSDKSAIEDTVDTVLIAGKLGCHIGGGTGRRYSYIDLALTDLDEAIRVLRRRLQAGKVPKRSWILFFDAEFADEWVGRLRQRIERTSPVGPFGAE
jgi:hypothetical protein